MDWEAQINRLAPPPKVVTLGHIVDHIYDWLEEKGYDDQIELEAIVYETRVLPARLRIQYSTSRRSLKLTVAKPIRET